MGDRAYITITTGASELDTISLYGHWAGNTNVDAVRNVLQRTDRIGDISYLTAQIFHEWTTMHDYDGTLSFGIFAGDCGEDENPTVYVNADNGEYTIKGEMFTEFAKYGKGN